MGRVLKIDSVNKIKSEKVAEFDTSIFSEVYQTATKLVREIIAFNEIYKKWNENDIERFSNENQISNVISFLGERGMGKSSAMLSFAFYLKHYYKQENVENKYKVVKENNKEGFYVLPKIDAAMIGAGENLLDIVLAKMWDNFQIKANQSQIKDYLYSETKNRFQGVKSAYSDYRSLSKNNEKLAKNLELKELHALSKSLNLRKEFTELVDCFLKCVEIDSPNNYLVICIDDLDIVKDGTYDILELIRAFLTIPKVIVLITADIDRLILDISSVFSEQLLYSPAVEKSDVEMIQGYARDYLAKILPINMRIYMPFFNLIDGGLPILEEELFQTVYRNGISDYSMTEKAFTKDIIAKYMGILLYPEFIAYSSAYKSLRNIVNTVNELKKIVQEDNTEVFLYQWIQKQVIIACNNAELSVAFRKFIRTLMKTSEDNCNYYIVNWSFNKRNLNTPFINPGYAFVLCQIAELEKESFQEIDSFWMLIWIYSSFISKMLYDKRITDIEEKIIRNDIFHSAMIHEGKTGWGYSRNIAPLLQMRLEAADTVAGVIEKNAKCIVDIFKMLLLCDIHNVLRSLEVEGNIQIADSISMDISEVDKSKKKEQAEIIEIRFKKIDSQCSIDYFIRNSINYEEKWKIYFDRIYDILIDAMWKRTGRSEKKVIELRQIVESKNMKIQSFQDWKNTYKVNDITDLLPFQSVGVMLEIVKELNAFTKDDAVISISNLNKSIEIIIQNLEASEAKYDLDNIGREDLKYAAKLKSLLESVDIKSVSQDKFDEMFKVGNETPDSTLS